MVRSLYCMIKAHAHSRTDGRIVRLYKTSTDKSTSEDYTVKARCIY